MIERIVSGGQTGVDRGALNAALAAGLPCGGWCPKGRFAEDGTITDVYPLDETPSADHAERTEWNVRDSDATLILTRKAALSGGTRLTRELANRHERPCLVVDPTAPASLDSVVAWLDSGRIKTLNLAGPRESGEPGIEALALAFVAALLDEVGAAGMGGS